MYFLLGRDFRLSGRVRVDVGVGILSSASLSSDSAILLGSDSAELVEQLETNWRSELQLL